MKRWKLLLFALFAGGSLLAGCAPRYPEPPNPSPNPSPMPPYPH